MEIFNMGKHLIDISVDNVQFNSVKEVAQLCDIKPATLYYCLCKDNCKTVYGYKIERLGKHKFNLTKNVNKEELSDLKASSYKAVKVKCLETGKIYPSITSIAKKLGLNMWTMSVKMEETGKFIDKNGNTYVRLKPMVKRTDTSYGMKSSSVTRELHRHKNNVSSLTSNVISTPSTKDLIIQNLVKSATLLTDNKNYTQAAQVLNILSEFDK